MSYSYVNESGGQVSCSHIAVAGGCDIYPQSIAFDNDPAKRTFTPSTEIVLSYEYQAWGYGGKPYEYMVFELSQTEHAEAPHPYFFVTRIKAQHGFATARLSLPYANATFGISYHLACFFSHSPLTESIHGGLISSTEATTLLKTFYRANYAGTKQIATVTSVSAEGTTAQNEIMTVYFTPGLKQNVDKQVAARLPPTFEWLRGADSAPGVRDEEYSYRLYPLEEWSHYSSATNATYYLLTPGQYLFEVRARYSVNGKTKNTAVASIPLEVKSVISAPPPLESLAKGDVASAQYLEAHRYPHSIALLIAVPTYNDPAFPALPYVKNDVTQLGSTLKERGFKVETLETGATKTRIQSSLNALLEQVERGDAVIVYFSGHGTSRGLFNYLVSEDCDSSNKEETCLSYEWLKKWIDKLMVERAAQHLLVIVDACQAGLGLYSKGSTRTPLQVLADYPGAHMMTAGLMEQNAHIDAKDGVSVFTKYLVSGLAGNADLTKDRIITLSELLVYVQDRVSKQVFDISGEFQVPVLGKIKGAGELLFRMP